MPPPLPEWVRSPIGGSVFVRAQRALGDQPLLLFQVTSHVPKVPKQPLMLDAPLESSFWKLWSDTEGGKLEESEEGSHRLSLSDPLPPIRPSSAQQHQEPYDDTKMLGSHREMPEKEKCDSKTSGSCTYIPMKYKGYEELLRVKTDPEFIEPAGMQQNVQALRRALKQPLVYRDSKARLDSVQKPYVPRKKKVKHLGQRRETEAKGSDLSKVRQVGI
uniref:Uncharacterized protein n=1 Tax=Chelonoidis abingdonii TaxID=106734 RepID=A0A8C0GJX4_CHEAB